MPKIVVVVVVLATGPETTRGIKGSFRKIAVWCIFSGFLKAPRGCMLRSSAPGPELGPPAGYRVDSGRETFEIGPPAFGRPAGPF